MCYIHLHAHELSVGCTRLEPSGPDDRVNPVEARGQSSGGISHTLYRRIPKG